MCTAPTADCDGNPNNGCEVDLDTDAANCGSCGYACGSGSTCSNGGCTLVQAGSGVTFSFDDFSCLAVDSTNVYFTAIGLSSMGPSGLLYVPTAGGAVHVLAGGATIAVGPAIYGNYVYWADKTAGKLYETPLPGQSGSTRTVVTGINAPLSVAVDANNVYWTSTGGAGAANKSTGTTLWTTNQPAGSAWNLVVDATDVYYTDPTAGAVVKVPIATGSPTVIAPNQTNARGIASDGTNIAWSMPPSGKIVETTKASPGTTPTLTGLTTPWSLAFDTSVSPSVLYWSQESGTTGNISKAALGATAPVIVAPNQALPECVVVTGNEIYWNVHNGTQLLKAAK
jgi:outer membrane protein assembly factor BamB